MNAAIRIALAGFAPVAFMLPGCGQSGPSTYQGYVEGEYVLVASPYAGSLQALDVSRGQTVAAGAPLFTLEQANETAGKRSRGSAARRPGPSR